MGLTEKHLLNDDGSAWEPIGTKHEQITLENCCCISSKGKSSCVSNNSRAVDVKYFDGAVNLLGDCIDSYRKNRDTASEADKHTMRSFIKFMCSTLGECDVKEEEE